MTVLLDEIEYQAGITPLETRELAEVGRRNVVKHIVRILPVRDVRRIGPESKLMNLGTIRMRDMNGELPVEPHIQGEVQREPFGIGCTDIILQNVDV